MGGVGVTRTTDGTHGSSGSAVKKYVDANVSISPSAVNEVGTAHTFTITVNALPGTATPTAFTSITPSVSPSPDSQSTTCGTPTVNGNTATCTFTINSSSVGSFTANATAVVTMGGVGVTRTTDGTHGSSGSAVKKYVDANVSISPSAVNEVGTAHTFTITVNALPGTATPTAFTSITPSVSPAPGSQSDTCSSPTVNGNTATCTLTINSNSVGTFTANATAVVTMGGQAVTRTTDGTHGSSGSATKKYVDANISITPTATNGITEAHTFSITVTALPGTATPVAFTSITPSVSPAPGSQSSTCSSPTVNGNTATCTVTINSNSAGVFTANATAVVTMGGVAVTRSTDGTHGSSGSATKTYVQGSISWVKHDNNGALLGGAVFTVCATGGTAASTGHTPLCVDVTDNSPPDADPVAGQFKVNTYQSFGGSALGGLAMGTYTIVEKTPPAGYLIDPSGHVETLTLTTSNPNQASSYVWVNTPPQQGCTPGFWQGGIGSTLWNTANDPDWTAHGGAGTNPFTTSTLFNSFFTPWSGEAGKTMLDLVGTGGGSAAADKAARVVVAEYLNAAFGLQTPYTTTQVAQMWTNAVAAGTDAAFTDVFNKLTAATTLGCPIS